MIRDELEFGHKNLLSCLDTNGITMIWDPLESKLIFEDKILDVIQEYNIKNETINQFINFVFKEDRDETIKLFNRDFKATYKNNEKIKHKYRVVCNQGQLHTFLFLGKVIKNNFRYYLIGSNYLINFNNNEEFSYKSMVEYDKLDEYIISTELRSIIDRDIITGLPNIYYFKRIVSEFLKDYVKDNVRASMIMLDLDNFKYVNDSFGHEFGDLLLKEVGQEIVKVVSKRGIVSRYSGDTFLIFTYNIESIEEVVDLCDLLSKSFDSPKIVNGKKIYLTASIGVALFPDHGNDYNTLLKNTDSAMHAAKTDRKNESNFFDDSILTELNRMYGLQKGLRTALEKGEIYVMFQPKVSLDDSLVNGFEALARWESHEFGSVSPAEFIPIAESTKMIVPIGNFILEEVFKKTKCLLNEGYDKFKIAVNLSEIQLREDVVISEFKRLIKKYKIHPKYIEVEITESMLMKSFDKNLKILQEIKDLGVSIALDDFGTGYSSLNYLTKLPIDVLKIDRSFVIDLLISPKSKCIVETIVNLSHQLGIEVVAEGVEDKDQVEYLRTILCDIVQGYYFSKPRMFEQIKEIIGKEIF